MFYFFQPAYLGDFLDIVVICKTEKEQQPYLVLNMKCPICKDFCKRKCYT